MRRLRIKGVGELKDEKLKEFLENMEIGESFETEDGYMIRKERGIVELLWGIYVLENGKAIPITRCEDWFDVPYRISKFVKGEGWLRMWGRGCNPLEEFNDEFVMVDIKNKGEYWVFSGKNKEYFRYIIWDEKLAKEIGERIFVKIDKFSLKRTIEYLEEYLGFLEENNNVKNLIKKLKDLDSDIKKLR